MSIILPLVGECREEAREKSRQYARENSLRLVHSVDPVQADADRLSAELRDANALVRRHERELEAVKDNLHAAEYSRDRKAEALELVMRQLSSKVMR